MASTLPQILTNNAKKISGVTYSQYTQELTFAVNKAKIVLGDVDFYYAAKDPFITETLDQVLVNFGIPGKNDNLIQTTGANNKQYSFTGILVVDQYTQESPLEIKRDLEKIIRKNTPCAYKVFYFEDSIQVIIKDVSFQVRNECEIEYTINCVEYTPPTIVSIDAQTWMTIHGDYTNITNTPGDDEAENPCKNFKIESFSQEELDDDSVPKGSGHMTVNIGSLQGWINADKYNKVYQDSQVRESLFGDYSTRSEVWSNIIVQCESCINTNAEKEQLKAFFNAVVSALLQRIAELYSDVFAACLTGEDLSQEAQYTIHIAMLDQLLKSGAISIGRFVSDLLIVESLYNEDGTINCTAICAITHTTFGLGTNVQLITNIKDVVFNDECCSATEARKDGATPDNNDTEDDLGDSAGEKESELDTFCPETVSPVATVSSQDFLYEYSCWKKDGGEYSGYPTYKEIDCPADVISHKENYEDIFVSYDNSFPRMDEETRTVILSSLIKEIIPNVQDRKVYAGMNGKISAISYPASGGTGTITLSSSDNIQSVEYSFILFYENLEKIYVIGGEDVSAGKLLGLVKDGELKITYMVNGTQYPFTLCFLG